VGTRRTTRCCSAVALIAVVSLTAAAQPAKPGDELPLKLFPVSEVWTLALNNQLIAPPAYSGSHAYFPIEGDRLAAYDLERGTSEWIVDAHPEFEPASGEGLLFIVQEDSFIARRTSDGSVAWQVPSVGPVAVGPVWDNGWLVVATRAGELLAFRALDGHLVWRRDLGSPARAQPSLAADRVYVPLDDGRVVAMRVDTGDTVWEHRLGGPPTGLLALDDRVYAGSSDNYFYALNADDGRVAWRWRTGADVIGVPVVDDGNVYFVALDNVLRGLSRKAGVQQWARPLPIRPTRGPLKVGRTLVVSGIAPTVLAYNIKDGTPAGNLPASGALAGPPYAPSTSPADPPQVLVVMHDIAKGATAVLFRRQTDPPIAAPAMLANAAKAVFLDPVTPAAPEP
jgi:outer membrane protein assembly factor BamB